jgi:membrane fusion protein, multidrug efflux system
MKYPFILVALLWVSLAMTGCTRAHGATALDLRPTVSVVRPQRGDMIRSITLPGDLVGLYQSTLYAKVTGYLKSISVDKGDWVKKGQVLAEIEVPELQQRVARAKANLDIQRLTYERLSQVWKSDPRLVARQDVDIAQGKYLEAKAQIDELAAITSYTQIVAPFDGIITGRFVDPGALIKAAAEQTSAPPDEGSAPATGGVSPVLSLALIDTMRAYVYVPQAEVSFVKRGMPAKLTLPDLAGRTFTGQVTRFANSLDLGTRTMLVEIDLQNKQHQLYPGMYASVTLELQLDRNVLKLPEAAIGDSPAGRYVMVAEQGKLRRQPITIGISNGTYSEVTKGLSGDEEVVSSVDPSLMPGEEVNIARVNDQSPKEAGTVVSKQ